MISRNEVKFLVLCGGLVAIMLAVVVSFVVGQPWIGYMIGTFGTFAWMLGFFAYVVLIDSRRRWPDQNTRQRFTNITTFTG